MTIDVVLSELGDWRRFRSQKAVTAFAGLDPGFRKSADKCLELHISKEGSRLLRWAMIQAAWRLAVRSPRWRQMLERLHANTGSKKKAIVGVARHLLCMMFAMLQSGRPYELLGVPNGNQRPPQAASRAETSARARQKGAAPSRLRRRVGLSLRGGVKADATAKAEGARGNPISGTPRRPYSTRSGVGPSSDPVL